MAHELILPPPAIKRKDLIKHNLAKAPGKQQIAEVVLWESDMEATLFVGNLDHEITDGQLKACFEPHGSVRSVKVICDRVSGRRRGYGFVEMTSEEQAQNAIAALNGSELDGRTLIVIGARIKGS